MKALQFIIANILVILLMCESAGLSFCAEHGVLIVEDSPDPTGLSPSSKLYMATFINNTKSDIVLEAVQMPGGYVGSGTFYNCLLEQWDEKKKVWHVIRRVDVARFVETSRKMITIKPKSREEACRYLLPYDAGSPGSCMRFRLERLWKKEGSPILSAPFVVGEKPASSKCPREE